MTIKEFARLCGCNPQTLRYYDHIDLLKPVRVDQWSGYRFYDEDQALAFVKIKSLQRAGFSIEEIKEMLEKDDRAVYDAFESKILEIESRLQEIKDIRKSYLTEMNDIQKKIAEVREKVVSSMKQYDPSEEFGISAGQYSEIVGNVIYFFENISEGMIKDIGYIEFSDGDAPDEEKEYLDLLNNPGFSCIYEKHGWAHVKDFFEEFGELDDGSEYALVFRVDNSKSVYTEAFGNTVLGILLAKNPKKKISLTCNMEESEDGKNHFWLLKSKKR